MPDIESEYTYDSSSSFSDDEEDEYDLHGMDLSEILKLEIENGDYTCLICTSEIDVDSKIWSCDVCYRVYDLECINQWSLRGLKNKPTSESGGRKNWKCPSCNAAYYHPVTRYTCWCGKVENPAYNGLIPHSCGQTCTEKLEGCVHGCSSMCHPGPHTECTAIGPAMRCRCGKNKKQWPCVITPYKTGWGCGSECGEWLPCGEHRCQRKCHDGLCGKCPELVRAQCYCGKDTREIPCYEKFGLMSELDNGDKWIGYFSCGQVCGEQFECGHHTCKSKCHSRKTNDRQCPFTPVENEKCPCGKTRVNEVLGGRERASCTEPLPTCKKQCGKSSKCGHPCLALCHTGPCPPCREVLPFSCACGSMKCDVPCAYAKSGSKFKCKKRCTAMMDCRRHRCSEICCGYEQTALDREKLRKKKLRSNISLGSEDAVTEPVHQCQETCNKLLNCEKHRCRETCHSGPCRPCLESSMEDYHCPCGRTTLQAPIRCGSMLPKCKHPCTRVPACGHPPVIHECHDDTVECPKCPQLVTKQCVCGKEMVKGVQCHREWASCGKICGKTLSCGHICQKVCHKEGDCEKPPKCRAICQKPLLCGHPHRAMCHPGKECGDVFPPCEEMVTVKCPCGHQQNVKRCNNKAETEVLVCNESCAIAERNRKLAEALDIDVAKRADEQAQHEYNDDLLDLYHVDPAFGDSVEQQLIDFVKGYAKSADQAFKVLNFPPMKSRQRMLIHLLAEEFNLPSVSQDAPPNRNVVVMHPARGTIPKARLRKYYTKLNN
ncbi:FKBP12-associated protein 1 [Trichomonascus vanleenenianus]|uniref:Fap1p n=1 Tax=Trichomonascus vanleenenianus TaxID=2268995 RepID=UPI003ECACCD8